MEQRDTGIDEDFAARSMAGIGAWILGRNMFGPMRGPWPDESWRGWWGKNPPYHAPVFVLTQFQRPPLEMEGGTVFHFVTEGIHAALESARAAAGGQDIRLPGGVATSRSIGGQRMRGSDGALLGDNFVIGKAAGGIRSALAWSSESDNYLVAFYAPGGGSTEILVRRVDKLGLVKGDEMNLSRDANYSGYPAVAYSEAGDQFLITWDHEPSDNVGNIRGQRVPAASGRMLGEPLDIATSGTENRSTIAYDNLRKRWLVQYNESATRGLSYNQTGRFVGTDGTLEDSMAIARTAAFEGDTLFGGDLAFTPGLRGRFFSSFASESDSASMSGQELLASGAPAGPQVKLGTGPYTCLNNAADTRLNRFLTVWEGLDGPRASAICHESLLLRLRSCRLSQQ